MYQTEISVLQFGSAKVKNTQLIISIPNKTTNQCDVSIGYVGMPNSTHKMKVGDNAFFETPTDGTFEVRLVKISAYHGHFLVSRISPRSGLTAGIATDDVNNKSFSSSELERVVESISQLKSNLARSSAFQREQLDLIDRKLSDIEAASQRLGRKDWITYVVGALTSLCTTAAFSDEARKTLFISANEAFRWLFESSFVLLP